MKKNIKKHRVLLGIDHGSKTIGLGISDRDLLIASPLETVKKVNPRIDFLSFSKIIKSFNVGGLVIGLPISMNGAEGPRCQSVRQFASNLLEKIEIPISFWDERLSSSVINRMLISEADMPRKRRATIVDKLAATYILQGFLDSLNHNSIIRKGVL